MGQPLAERRGLGRPQTRLTLRPGDLTVGPAQSGRRSGTLPGVTVTTPPNPATARPGTSDRLPDRRPWTVRVAGWSAAHRWPVFGLWFVATIGIFVLSLVLGGTKAVEAVSNDERSKYEAGEALVVWNEANPPTTTAEPASEQFLMVVTSPGRTVDDPGFAADVAGITKRLLALQATVDGVSGPVVEQLIDPIGVADPRAAALISPDRTAVRLVGRVPGDGPVSAKRLA